MYARDIAMYDRTYDLQPFSRLRKPPSRLAFSDNPTACAISSLVCHCPQTRPQKMTAILAISENLWLAAALRMPNFPSRRSCRTTASHVVSRCVARGVAVRS